MILMRWPTWINLLVISETSTALVAHNSMNLSIHAMRICFINTLKPRPTAFSRRHFQMNFFNENVWISINISLKFVPKRPINNILALVQIMAWHQAIKLSQCRLISSVRSSDNHLHAILQEMKISYLRFHSNLPRAKSYKCKKKSHNTPVFFCFRTGIVTWSSIMN